jgi:hypothetical protein
MNPHTKAFIVLYLIGAMGCIPGYFILTYHTDTSMKTQLKCITHNDLILFILFCLLPVGPILGFFGWMLTSLVLIVSCLYWTLYGLTKLPFMLVDRFTGINNLQLLPPIRRSSIQRHSYKPHLRLVK